MILQHIAILALITSSAWLRIFWLFYISWIILFTPPHSTYYLLIYNHFPHILIYTWDIFTYHSTITKYLYFWISYLSSTNNSLYFKYFTQLWLFLIDFSLKNFNHHIYMPLSHFYLDFYYFTTIGPSFWLDLKNFNIIQHLPFLCFWT